MSEKFAEWLPDEEPPVAKTDLELCHDLIANLRAAMLATASIMHRNGLHDAANLLADATGTDERARMAQRALEEDAGYIAGTQEGECYP